MLSLLGRVYALAMRIRARAYTLGLRSSWRPPGVCISVGNISWGGSGKTPVCAWLLRWGLDRGYSPVLLSRGYGARPPHLPYLVYAQSPVHAAGDEPLMLARQCPQAAIVVDPCRARGGQWASSALQPDLFILDDGLQHLQVQRDVDLVLFTPRDLGPDWNRVIPGGPWREGPTALSRATAFLCNAQAEALPAMHASLQARLGSMHPPVFDCHYSICGLRRVVDNLPVEPTGDKWLLVSGVGNPDGVEASAGRILPRPPQAHLRFADHHAYTARDWAVIAAKAQSLGTELIVCTQKDGVKLEQFADMRLCALDLGLQWFSDPLQEGGFGHWLERCLADMCGPG